jgi:hypothetical protein
MAEPTVLKNCYLAFTTSTASTTYVEVPGLKTISWTLAKAELANGVMGDVAEPFHPGLISLPIEITTRQDFTTTVAATSGADKLFYNLWANETKFTIKTRAVDAAVSGTNPSYKFTPVRVFSLTPIDGSHGALLEQKVSIRPASTFALTRSTST